MPGAITLVPSLILRSLGQLIRAGGWQGLSCRIDSPRQISADFFGINVASAESPDIDNFVVEQLRALGIRQVRMDMSFGGFGSYPERFLKRLIEEDYQVLLRLVQPVADAAVMDHDHQARERWGSFLEAIALRMPIARLAGIEIGNTPNRRRWSGYTHRSYLAAWQMASMVLNSAPLAGPNVSDFEPLHTLPLLLGMKRVGRMPDVHTHNLFVERVREPEAFDHRVLGRFMAPHLKLNLVKKARVFHDISNRLGINQTWCTHTCWNGERLARWTSDIETKRADYLVRYLVPAALSGALDRVYWGPLIGATDGLVDDGTGGPGPAERVAFYESALGDVGQYQVRPALLALKQLVAILQETTGTAVSEGAGELYRYDFTPAAGSTVSVCWTRDGQSCPIPPDLAEGAVEVRSASGVLQEGPPGPITEHPVFIKS